MNAVFADTSYYLAFVSPTDPWHAAALAWAERLRRPRVTSEFVLIEVGNALNRGDEYDGVTECDLRATLSNH